MKLYRREDEWLQYQFTPNSSPALLVSCVWKVDDEGRRLPHTRNKKRWGRV